jgi:hypothetical protein
MPSNFAVNKPVDWVGPVMGSSRSARIVFITKRIRGGIETEDEVDAEHDDEKPGWGDDPDQDLY